VLAGSRRQPLAPGSYFLLRRVAVKTATGVIGLRAGTEVYLVREEEDGEHCRVKTNDVELTVSRFDITKNAELAEKYAAPGQKTGIRRRFDSQQTKGKQATLARAQEVVLGSVEFHDAALGEVIMRLNDQARQSDQNGRGVTVNTELPEAEATGNASASGIPPITLSLRNVTLLQAVRATAQQAHLAVRSEPYGLVIYGSNGRDIKAAGSAPRALSAGAVVAIFAALAVIAIIAIAVVSHASSKTPET
jgi:hypothetical protein